MNFTFWKGELEIFEESSVLADDEDSIIHLWNTTDDNVVFRIKEGYKIVKKDDGYGNNIYVVEKNTN